MKRKVAQFLIKLAVYINKIGKESEPKPEQKEQEKKHIVWKIVDRTCPSCNIEQPYSMEFTYCPNCLNNKIFKG